MQLTKYIFEYKTNTNSFFCFEFLENFFQRKKSTKLYDNLHY